MADVFRVGDLVAQPGSKVRGYLKVVGTDQEMPITLVNGVRQGKTIDRKSTRLNSSH